MTDIKNSKTIYKKGDWNIICDVCGCKMKRSEAMKRWDGMIVCGEDWERRHPNDFPPPRFPGEGRAVPDARPEQTDTFEDTGAPTAAFNKGKKWGDMSGVNWGNWGGTNKWGDT